MIQDVVALLVLVLATGLAGFVVYMWRLSAREAFGAYDRALRSQEKLLSFYIRAKTAPDGRTFVEMAEADAGVFHPAEVFVPPPVEPVPQPASRVEVPTTSAPLQP